MGAVLRLLLLLGLVFQAQAQIYVLAFGAWEQGRGYLNINSVDSFGNVTLLAHTFTAVETILGTVDGISTFDQVHNRFFYAQDFQGDFVYGADVFTGALTPPIDIGAEYISSLNYDAKNDQLLVHGVYYGNSEAIVQIPYDVSKPAGQLFNLTLFGVGNISATAFDPASGIYYIAYFTKGAHQFGFFNVNSPSQFRAELLPCSAAISIRSLFYDSNLGALVGLSYNATTHRYDFVEIVLAAPGKCVTRQIPFNTTEQVLLSAAYDPSSYTLVINLLGYAKPTLVFFNVQNYDFSELVLADPNIFVIDVAISTNEALKIMA